MKNSLRNIYRFLNPRFQTIHLDYTVDAKPRYTLSEPHPQLLQIISAQEQVYKSLLNEVVGNKDFYEKLQDELSSTDFTWRNDFLPAWDTVLLHTILGKYRPKRYIEIGSGYSTLVTRQAIKDHQLSCTVTSIDPQPRASIVDQVDIPIRKPVENVALDTFDQLESGDVLFIDNSHRLLPNSDVMVFFLEILPSLKTGVIVHLHDIYLPYDYPKEMCDRMYNEQYALAISLLFRPDRFEILMPSFYVSQVSMLAQILDPIWALKSVKNPESHGGSFWTRINH